MLDVRDTLGTLRTLGYQCEDEDPVFTDNTTILVDPVQRLYRVLNHAPGVEVLVFRNLKLRLGPETDFLRSAQDPKAK